MAQYDNYVESRGYGEWTITTYNPEKEFGVYEGFLKVSRDFHVIYAQDNNSGIEPSSECIASFPSPNVAAAENTLFTKIGNNVVYHQPK